LHPDTRICTQLKSCTVTVSRLKYQVPMAIGTARCCRRVTQPPHIAGPLGLRFRAQYHNNLRTSKSLAACHRDSPHNCQTHAILPSSLIQFTFNQDYFFSDLECELTTNICKLILRLIVKYIYIL